MLYFFYNIILLILLIVYLPVALYKMMGGKYRQGFKQRFGFIPPQIIDNFKDKPLIWVHAVSVGETVAAGPIVTELKKAYPQYKILFSTVTDTGHKMARKIIKEADEFIYFPLDFSWIVNRVLNRLKPDMVILTETELWPNFIRLAARKDISIMLANGRISDTSAKKYRYLGPFMKDIFANIDILSMQSQQDKKYALNLGAPPSKVYNTGNTKFDQDYGITDRISKNELYRQFKIKKDQPVFIAGSTHANEEEQLIYVYKKLKEQYPELQMIIAPRHIDRSNNITSLYENDDIDTIRYTSLKSRKYNDEQVIIIDVIGVLARIYSIADLVFIGGSLVDIGGHNMLEASVQGKLTLFGPYMYNFKDSTELVVSSNTGVMVKDKEELAEKMLCFLSNPDNVKKRGEKARQVINNHKGAADSNIKLVAQLLANQG